MALSEQPPISPPGPSESQAPSSVPDALGKKPVTRKKTSTKLWLIGALALVLVAGGAWAFMTSQSNKKAATDKAAKTSGAKVRLVYATHWTEKPQLDGLQKYLDEYTKLHPNIEFVVQVIPYAEYADKLKVLNDAGAAPDIYQIYSNWGVNYVKQNMLDTVPKDIQTDIEKNYLSHAGATIDGQIRGIPTEINDYAILYNKELFKAAGIVDLSGNALAPKTWAELVTDAGKLTKKDAKGATTQYGFAMLKGNDWEMVDPFLSLLFSNGGQYLSADLKKSLFNSPAGVAALDAQLALAKNGSTSLDSNFFDFGKGTVGLVVSPPWTKGTFKTAFGDKFASTVGVAPLPTLKDQKSLQYSWFMGVTNASIHKSESWDFLRWFTGETQTGTKTTRYGDLLANVIGAIPDRKTDLNNHPAVLGDFFTKTFVDQLANSQAEPNVANSSIIKTTLMNEVQSAWAGQKTAQQALDTAASAIDKTLQE